MSICVVAQFNSNPTPSHLVGYCRSGAATQEAVKYEIANLSCSI